MNKKPTSLFVYLLGAYVILQFVWWGYSLINLTLKLEMSASITSKRVVMIVGEGSVFLILLLFGLYKIKSSVKKEMKLAQQQNNFMLSVTHELKTPIAANKLYLQTLVKHQLAEEKRNELMHKAIDETNRLESLVDQILTASRLEQQAFALHKDKFQIRPFLDEIVSIQEKRIQMSLKLVDFEDFSITTDRMMFTTILNNLTENANKYARTEQGVELSVTRFESHFVLAVQDFGPGVKLEQQKQIFKKFIRLENEETRTTKGTGLGLYIAYEFSRALGGQLRLVSNESQSGARFDIQLPYE